MKAKLTLQTREGNIKEKTYEILSNNTINIGVAVIPLKEADSWFQMFYKMKVLKTEVID